jgi:hypothetical protein
LLCLSIYTGLEYEQVCEIVSVLVTFLKDRREAGTVPARQEVAIKKWAGSKAGRPRAIAVKN